MAVAQWVKTLTFYEILVGMKATITVLIDRIVLRKRKAVTLQYPHEKRALPGTYRGMIALLKYDDDTEKCVGCDLCEAACPSRVITVISSEVEGEPMKRSEEHTSELQSLAYLVCRLLLEKKKKKKKAME